MNVPRKIRRLSGVALCLCATALGSCNAGFHRFALLDADGRSVALRESPGKPKDREGRLDPARGAGESPYYGLSKPVTVGADKALAVRYTSTLAACQLTVYADRKAVLARASLPPAGAVPVRFLVSLEPGAVIRGFGLSTASASGELSLDGAAVETMRRGFALEDGTLRLDASIRSLQAPALSGPLASFTVELSDAARRDMGGRAWLIGFSPAGPPEGGGSGILDFSDADGKRPREFSVRSEGGSVDFFFSKSGLGFLPRTVSFSSDTPGWGLTGMLLESVADGWPIPADPGQVLSADRALWRNVDFELYAWDRFPDFLIMDTADYAVMDRLFNRLAYFVEKAGFAGRILDDDALQGKHAYNAHDYRAEDLARFFSMAEAQGARLNRWEDALRQNLERAGVVVRRGSGYGPGKGGILAISREGGGALRELLLTHECFHGVFFSLPEFREAAGRQWEALSPAESRVWKAFLRSRGYNTEDSYLTVNEFQSYLFQQEEPRVGGFQATVLTRLEAAFPAMKGDIAEVRSRKPASFLSSFRSLDASLRALGGPPGGRVIFIRPLD